MAYERTWAAVPPQPLTADGTVTGLVTVADTAGFKVKQSAYLKNTAGTTLAVQVKIVLSSTQLVVGTINNAQIANWPKLDISSWTVASGAVIGAEWQPKSTITPEDIIRAIYESDPTTSIRVSPVDQYGNKYNLENTFPVNIIPDSSIPFTLGSLALPSLVSNLIAGLSYDKVTSDNVDGQETLTFYSGGLPLTTVTLTKQNDGWILNIGAALGDFLLLESGSFFELEDGTGEILLET